VALGALARVAALAADQLVGAAAAVDPVVAFVAGQRVGEGRAFDVLDPEEPIAAKLYRPLINAFYFAVKSVNRSNLVLAAGLGPVAVPRYTIGPLRFARELFCMKGRRKPRPMRGNCHGGVHFDIFDIHPYTTGGPTHEGHVLQVTPCEYQRQNPLSVLVREPAEPRSSATVAPLPIAPPFAAALGWQTPPPRRSPPISQRAAYEAHRVAGGR